MPIPNPSTDESKDEYISRCVPAIIDEYGQEQSVAICYSKWDKKDEFSCEPFYKEKLHSFLGRCMSDKVVQEKYKYRPSRVQFCFTEYQRKYLSNIGKKWK